MMMVIGQSQMGGINTPPKNKIPKTIIQTMTKGNLPEQLRENCLSWQKYNPEYNYKFFDGDDRISYLKLYTDQDTIKAYFSLSQNAFKADLFRSCYLYNEGGVYSDIDFRCSSSLNNIICPSDQIVTGIRNNQINQGIIITVPKSPILYHLIQTGIKRIFSNKPLLGTKYWGVKDVGYFGPVAMCWSWGVFHRKFYELKDLDMVYQHRAWTKNHDVRSTQIWQYGRYNFRNINFNVYKEDLFSLICSDEYSKGQYKKDLNSMDLTHWSTNLNK